MHWMAGRGIRWAALLAAFAGFARAAPAEESHARLYKKCAPAVVGLTCKAKLPDGPEGDYFGTGAVVSADGLILTNTTVIPDGAREIRVYFVDGRVFPGQLTRSDAASEGVLVKVEARGLKHMPLADSSAAQPGAPVYSWGNPYFTIMRDGGVSLSAGSISGVYVVSSVDDQSRYVGPVLETDAAVNPGSDGGPLTDCEGRLLGIMSLAFSRTRWLGLAIPTHRLAQALPDLKKVGLARDTPRTPPELLAHSVLSQAARAAGEATVAVLAAREGEGDPPETLAREDLPPEKAYPRGPMRGVAEIRRPPGGAGSGFIVDAEGLVVTAASNVADPENVKAGRKVKAIYVYLPSGQRVEAKLLGRDSFHDLAVLKINAPDGKRLPRVALGSSSGLAQGRMVAALGRSEPPGRVTINAGSISAVGRYSGTCAQTSALLNYGNLGGPVVDLEGAVVGMASHLTERTPWRQNCGVGFVLVAEKILELLPALKEGKTVERPHRPFLGVQADMGALDVPGARVARVLPNGPAAKAGLRDGDVIVEFQGQAVDGWLTLLRAIRASAVGQEVTVKVMRDDDEVTVTITLGQQD